SGAVRARVPQRDADRHRRLPRRVHWRVLCWLALDRDHLQPGRDRPAQLRVAGEPRLSGGVRHRLYLLADGSRGESAFRPDLYVGRSSHRFRDPRGLVRMDAPIDTAIIETTTAAGVPRRLWLSPLQRRRWHVFKLNRRGFWSLWLFLILFVISLGSE